MKRILLAMAMANPLMAQKNPDFSKMKIDGIYKDLCASCHGAKFEGGLGGSLVDGLWKYGSTDADIMKAIRDGNAELGMTAFGTVLDDQKIRSMVIYLREKEKETRVAGIQFPKPKPGEITKTELEDYQIEVVTENLSLPWAIAFLPNGVRLVTEKGGALRLIDSKGTLHPLLGICFWRECLEAAFGPERRGENGGWFENRKGEVRDAGRGVHFRADWYADIRGQLLVE